MPPDRAACKVSSLAVLFAIPNTYQVRIHNSCLCNEECALRNRHLVDRTYIPFNNALWLAALSYSLPIINLLDCKHTNIWNIANGYTGGKRKQYLRACDMLEQEGLMRKDAVLKMFVKPDKIAMGEIASKAPRAIQYRSPKYNLLLASYLKDFEHQFYTVKTGPSETCDIAKGKNLVERADDILAKATHFRDPVFFNIDYSKMDSCVRPEHQRSIFRRVYLKKFPSKTLKRLLFYQLKNKGYSKNGIRYRVQGTRCSGDFTTGFENSLINWIIMRYVLHSAGLIGELYLDGDDSVVMVERQDADKFIEFANKLIPQLGFEIKMSRADDIQQVDFCQSRLLLTEPPRMARNPLRALSNFNISLKTYPAKIWPNLIQAKADCERFGNPGVPILQRIGERCDLKVKALLDKEQEDWLKLQRTAPSLHVTDSVRQSYCIAWDISPYEQELIEEYPDLISKCAVTRGEYESVYQQYQTLEENSNSIN